MLVIPNAPCVFLVSFIHSTNSQLKSRGCTLGISHRPGWLVGSQMPDQCGIGAWIPLVLQCAGQAFPLQPIWSRNKCGESCKALLSGGL